MKKVLLILVAVMGLAFTANAQNIGARFKTGNLLLLGESYGAEFSFQLPLGDNNRLELDAGYSYGEYINFAAAYQWTFPIAGDFGWFIGPCANLGYCIHHHFGLSVGAQGGAEWKPSNFPIQISADVRPLYDFLMNRECAYKGFAPGFAVSVRYRMH